MKRADDLPDPLLDGSQLVSTMSWMRSTRSFSASDLDKVVEDRLGAR